MKNISAAFVKAQKEFGVLLKDSNNPFFKSKYADLSSCVNTVLTALNNNGIGLIQNCHESDNGVIVETIFLHETGEQISCGKLHVPAIKQDPQMYGSALTYARRYSLMAACGIAPEDDDGNAASRAPVVKIDMTAIIEKVRTTRNMVELHDYAGAVKASLNPSQLKELVSAYNSRAEKLSHCDEDGDPLLDPSESSPKYN